MPQEFTARNIVFTGEQDGPPERQLKQALAEAFRGGTVAEAYLARALVDGVATVLLAVRADAENEDLVRQAGAVFAAIFNSRQHLDVVFLDDERQAQVSRVCGAFYQRAR